MRRRAQGHVPTASGLQVPELLKIVMAKVQPEPSAQAGNMHKGTQAWLESAGIRAQELAPATPVRKQIKTKSAEKTLQELDTNLANRIISGDASATALQTSVYKVRERDAQPRKLRQQRRKPQRKKPGRRERVNDDRRDEL